jgi:DHA1 family bicyclomycin/chloramphenicol resistance-like MFS transporter
MLEARPVAAAVLPAAHQMTARRPPLHLLLVLSGLMALGSLSTDMYLPALPAIAEAYGVTMAGVQLTLTTFLVGFCGGQLIWGPIGDRYGRRFPAGLGRSGR